MSCYLRWQSSSPGADWDHTPFPDVATGVVVMTMPAVVLTAERKIALEERPRPILRPDQVMVEVELCGICGSDLHAAQLPQVYHDDCILGHESTGQIVALGTDVA